MSTNETGLGATIHAWRDRLTPADVGLPARRGRRAVGLRREELSELAGISVDYIVRHRSRFSRPTGASSGGIAVGRRCWATPGGPGATRPRKVSSTAAAKILAERDPIMARLVAEVGLPSFVRPTETHFTALVRPIIYQQLAGPAARAIYGRMVAALGGEITPEALLAISPEALRAAGLSQHRRLVLLASRPDLCRRKSQRRHQRASRHLAAGPALRSSRLGKVKGPNPSSRTDPGDSLSEGCLRRVRDDGRRMPSNSTTPSATAASCRGHPAGSDPCRP